MKYFAQETLIGKKQVFRSVFPLIFDPETSHNACVFLLKQKFQFKIL